MSLRQQRSALDMRRYRSTIKLSKVMQKIDYIGVDVSHLKLDINSHNGQKECLKELPNTVSQIKEWVGGLPENAHVVFEATGIYSHKLEYLLSERGLGCTKLNPNKVKGFALASGCLSKDDRHDAQLIRRYGEAFQVKSTRAVEAAQIKQERYVHALSKLKKSLQSIENQIHVIKQEPIELDQLLWSYEQIKDSIQAQMSVLEQELKTFRSSQQVQELDLLQSIPGIGPKSAQAIVHAIGSFDYFETDKQLVRFLGVAPVTASSGTSVKKTLGICRTAVPQVRASLYMAVTSAIKSNPSCRELHLRLRQKGKPKKVARMAVVNKLIRQAFAVVKSEHPFDPQFEKKKPVPFEPD